MRGDASSERLIVSDRPDLLNAAENAFPSAVVDVVARQLLTSIGATEVDFLIADISGECLVPITRVSATEWPLQDTGKREDVVSIHDSYAGIALRRQRTQIVADGDGARLFAPVTSRGDAIGVLDLKLAKRPSRVTVDEVDATAHILAYIVIVNRRHTDLFAWGQRSRPMTLAAEIQRRLVPGSFTCEAGSFTVAAWLEPSAEAAGDTFDYSFDESHLSLSMTDAMGHSVNAALLATVAVSALRNARQGEADLARMAAAANASLVSYASDDQFVTGLLVDIPFAGGPATIINAGHPLPLLLRDESIAVVPLHPDPPFGMFAGTTYQVQTLDLRIGDRLILVTDGVLERNAAGFDIRAAISDLAGLHPRETVRQLCRYVIDAAGGGLEDDATVLCLDWHGEPGLARESTSGADDVGASL